MKFLKFRYIFTLAIVLVIGITLMVYFLGGLSATALGDSNIEFSYEGYLDYSEYDEEGIRYVFYETLEEMNEATKDLPADTYEKHDENEIYYVKYFLSSEKIVAQNDKYTMFLDEKTTIVTVAVNSSYKEEVPTEKTSEGFIKYKLSLFDIKYDTAIKGQSNDAAANLLLRYVGSNAKESSIIYNTFNNSVSYHDKLVDQKKRHYKINFSIENGIEILYEIGDFTIYDSFFPKYISRDDFFNYFKGNLVFVVNSDSIIGSVGKLKKNTLEYTSTQYPTGYAYTSSKECADYLAAQGVATVVPNYYGSTEVDEFGEKVPTRYDLIDIVEPQRDEEGNVVINPTTQQPYYTNVLKLKAGIHYNPANVKEEGASPCITNPFANSYTLQDLFVYFYNLIQQDENDPTIKYTTDWRYTTENLSPTFRLRATGSQQNTKMYEYMYKKNTDRDPNILYEKTTTINITEANYLDYVDDYPGIMVGDKINIKIPVSYFEDLNKVFYGFINAGSFYEDELFTKPLNDTSKYDYFVDSITSTPYILNEEGKFVKVDKSIPVGGFQAKDEDGNFLYDEEGNPIQDVFTIELANVQSEKYGIESESTPPIFQVAMRFELTDKGLKTTVLENSILEGLGKKYVDENGKKTPYSHDLHISRLQILPYFTTNNSITSEGQIIIPDGSGAVISFNSPKAILNYDSIEKRIYGPDKAFTFETSKDDSYHQRLMFGMYGFLDKTNRKGVLAIIDQGASQSTLIADFKRDVNTSRNYATFEALIREKEEVFVGSARTAFTKWAHDRSKTDFSYIYQFLTEDEFIDSEGNIQYVTLAQKYRDYLIAKYDLENKDNTKKNILAINFLGAFEKREVTFGFPHNVDYSLTTFAQAQAIIEELEAEGVEGFTVSYTSWTKDAMEPKATNRVKVSKVLGNLRGLEAFKEFLDGKKINLYPEVRITSNKGYDYSFGNMKYTAKGVGSTYAQHREFDLATRRASNTVKPITMLSPVYYKDYIKGYLKSYKNLGLTSAFLSDIGNVTVGDYSKSRTTYAQKGLYYQQDTLDYARENLDSIMLSAPYDYALKYVDFAVDVPLQSTQLKAYDYSIPFYQLVVSGLFDYAGTPVNYDSENNSLWYLLKSLETGSNLQFMISAGDPKILMDTDYTMYYESYYTNSKNDILSMNRIINEVGIHGSRLMSHKMLKDNVFEVEYKNGVKIVINYTDSYFLDVKSGLSVRPKWFVVVEEANNNE
jgi:hypothetical protein